MVVERSKESSPKKEFQKVGLIFGPGEYMFSSNPNADFRYYGGASYHDSLGGVRPHFEQDTPHHLRKNFPGIWSVQFHPATLYDGEYTPAKLEYSSDLEYLPEGFVGFEGEVYYIRFGGRSSNGYGDWHFSIKDLGNLSIEKNKLLIAQPKNRDGNLNVRLSGTAPHFHRDTGRSWRGWISVEGEKPGVLVKVVINYMNDVRTNSDIPLWKAS